jgi:hypothetical protein
MKNKKREFPKATGLARTIPKPPNKPVFETKTNPSDKFKKNDPTNTK